MLTASAVLLLALPLVAANVNGFENFVLTREPASSSSSTISSFSSRTRTAIISTIMRFNSGKPCGIMITIR